MAGNERSGNRTERRGVKLRRVVTLTAPAAILVRVMAQGRYGVHAPTEEQTNAIVEELMQAGARAMSIETPPGE